MRWKGAAVVQRTKTMAWVKIIALEMLPTGYISEIFVIGAIVHTDYESGARKHRINDDA